MSKDTPWGVVPLPKSLRSRCWGEERNRDKKEVKKSPHYLLCKFVDDLYKEGRCGEVLVIAGHTDEEGKDRRVEFRGLSNKDATTVCQALHDGKFEPYRLIEAKTVRL